MILFYVGVGTLGITILGLFAVRLILDYQDNKKSKIDNDWIDDDRSYYPPKRE